MRIITSKTDQAIRNEFGRRSFLKLAGSAGFGAVVYSELGPISLAVGPPSIKPSVNWKGILGEFGEFALNVGLLFLGSKVSEWLSNYPRWDTAVRSLAKGINRPYIPYDDYGVIGDRRTIFFPMYNQRDGRIMLPFYDLSSLRLSSEISMFTAAALPRVNSELTNEHYSRERAALLIPRASGSGSYNNFGLPERYGTDAGSANFHFKGDDRGGDVSWTLWARMRGKAEQPYRKGNVYVSFR